MVDAEAPSKHDAKRALLVMLPLIAPIPRYRELAEGDLETEGAGKNYPRDRFRPLTKGDNACKAAFAASQSGTNRTVDQKRLGGGTGKDWDAVALGISNTDEPGSTS
jgi:hypothetical protein